MKMIKEGKLSETLPPNMIADEKIAALAAVLDEMLIELTREVTQVIHLPRLDELSGPILDLLMYEFHVDFAEPLWLKDEVKRNLIRESIAWHRRKGTRYAVEVVNEALKREVRIQEWFEYKGGQAHWFRIYTRPFKSEGDMLIWLRQLQDVKPVRSWCEVIFEVKKEVALYVGIGRWKHGKKRRAMTAGYEVGRTATTIQDGARTLIISATQVIIRYGADEEIIPINNLFGDVLKMRFSFPTSDRILTIENPREDLTAEEVQEVADYATANKIFLDGSGRDTQGELKRATLLTTTTQILF